MSRGLIPILLVLLVAAASVSAQPVGIVIGTVTGSNGRPVQGARVHLSDGTRSTGDRAITDHEGRFILPALMSGPGTYAVEASSPGFEGAAYGVLVSSGRNSEVKIALAPEGCLCEFPGFWEVPLVSRDPFTGTFYYDEFAGWPSVVRR